MTNEEKHQALLDEIDKMDEKSRKLFNLVMDNNNIDLKETENIILYRDKLFERQMEIFEELKQLEKLIEEQGESND